MGDSDSSSDNEHTPKRKGSRRKSRVDDSPISNVSFGSESPVVPWDFPRPKVSKKVKEAAKELRQMMNQVCRSKRKRQKLIERPEIPNDPLSSPISHYRSSYSRSSLIDTDEAPIDYEALENIELGRPVSSHSSPDRANLKPRTSHDEPSLSHHKKLKFDEKPKLSEMLKKNEQNGFSKKPNWVRKTADPEVKPKFGPAKESGNGGSKTVKSNGNLKNSEVQPKEDLQKKTQPKVASVQELLEEDMCFFLTPELASL